MVRASEEAHALGKTGRWVDARQLLEGLPPSELTAEDLELLAIATGLTGHVHERVAWERASQQYLSEGNPRRAAWCAFWLALDLVNRRQMAPAMGWFQRGQRLLDEAGATPAEAVRFQIPIGLQELPRDPAGALERFETILEAAESVDDREVAAFARLGRGQALIRLGDMQAGVASLDEAMAAAIAGDVMPIGVGIIYCAVILECRRAFDTRRAREWTGVLSAWCDRQQGLVPFRGQCLVHRSEVAQIDGDWATAWDEATAACDHLADAHGDPILGLALYQRAELHRLRGEFAEAEEDYTQAAEVGRVAGPGLQLLRLAQGRVGEAASMIARARAEARGPVQKARILAAYVRIMLAAGERDSAREAAEELAVLAEAAGSTPLQATAAQSTAAVLVATGASADALRALATADELWHGLAAPYEIAQVRLLRAEACRQLGDVETAQVERVAATTTLESLGAAADLAELRARTEPADAPGGLSPRELEVVGLVATGMTNREIATALTISEKTVARHVSNIFTKINVGSRSAATAWAHRRGVV